MCYIGPEGREFEIIICPPQGTLPRSGHGSTTGTPPRPPRGCAPRFRPFTNKPMSKRYYFFITAKPGKTAKKEKLKMITAPTEQEARKRLFTSMKGTDFIYRDMGYVPEEEMHEAIIPESAIDNPIQAISAVEYVRTEYDHLFSDNERRAMKSVKGKLIKSFFN